MSNLIPGNQKHLTLDKRVFLEKCLDQNMTMKDIAKPLCKDPSTISKEIKKHRTFHPHNDLTSRGPMTRCINKKDCSLKKVCLTTSLCTGRCASCKKVYRATTANRDYRSVLIEAREVINTTEADLKVLDEVVLL